MLRKRLIFTLIYSNGNFMLSRNFRLQKVGDLNWLEKHYSFKDIAFSIDELLILNATRYEKNIDQFSKTLQNVVSNIYVPVSAGGGIRSLEDAEILFSNGADKIVVNSLLHDNKQCIKDLVEKYGSQSIIASIDYKYENKNLAVYINDGTLKLDIPLEDYLKQVIQLNIGEIYINSIDKDGTGQGYDIERISQLIENIEIPVILSGGAGNASHLIEGINIPSVDAVATANLFNFIGDGLPKARSIMIQNNINLAKWDREWK